MVLTGALHGAGGGRAELGTAASPAMPSGLTEDLPSGC